ncbi:GNAT family N-acetyltransferase, partial [Candidatus Woesearchaeota archaeon]|nr:GNAT family N-acetyltransferase [Candidatus Woesearchaeota archaeon]
LIDELYIKPGCRKTGAGKALTNKMIEWFKSKNMKWTIVLTHSQDKGANSYWKHMGYKDYNRKYKMGL